MPDRDILAETTETEPHPAPIFDTGPHPQPLSRPGSERMGFSAAVAVVDRGEPAAHGTGAEPRLVPAAPLNLPGQNQYLKWWKLLLVLVAVWVPAAGIGMGLFAWWYSLIDKTPAVFVVFIYVAVCTVAGVMLAMVPDRPLVAALAIAVMSAVFASTVAAAPLYGHHYCQVKSPCLAGIIPY